MKKTFLGIMLFAILAMIIALPNQSVSASIDEAVTISVNKTQKGILTDYYDEDYYKFTIPAAGNVKLSIKNKADSEWYGKITNSANETYEDLYSDDSELVEGYSTTQVGLPKGTYYIKIDYSSNAANIPYEFKLEFTQSNVYEKEFNNNLTNANAISLNTFINGSISDYYDKDFYKITLPSDGNVTLTMKQQTDAQWYAHIQNSNGTVFESLYTDDSELVEGYATTQVGLPKGTYYIQVKNSSYAYNEPYQFQVGFTSSEFYEKESNDSITAANEIQLNKDYIGSLRDSSDKDFYKIVVPSDGNITLSLNQEAGAQWYGHIQNSKGEIFESLYTDDSELVEGTASVEVGLPKGTYYVQIKNNHYAYDKPYSFKIGFKASAYYEKEFNNSLTLANVISLNKTYSGRISDSRDTDVFKFTVPSDGNVTLSIKQAAGASWYGHIQNGQGTIFKSIYTDSSELVSGNATVQTTLKKGTYYFVLKNSYYSYEKPYQFSLIMKSENLKAAQVKATNNKGKNDTVAVSGLVKGDVVKVYNASTKGTLLTSMTATGTTAKLSVKQLGTKAGKVYVTVTKTKQAESDRVAISYKGEKTDTPKASQVKVTNNKGKNDKVVVSGLVKGDVVKVYNASTKGTLLTSITSTGTSTTLSVKQLGTKAGKVYVTVTKTNQTESDRVAISYKGEITDTLKASQVKVTNNKGKNDTVVVSGLVKGDVVKVYNASTKGTLLTSITSTGTSTTLSVKQLGTKAGKVYVTVTKTNQTESDRVAISYKGEITDTLKASQVKVTNNKGKNDTVVVSGLVKGDVVKVYNASTKGTLLTSITSTGTSTTLSVKQLGTKAGNVYVTVSRAGMLESSRTAVSYKAEK